MSPWNQFFSKKCSFRKNFTTVAHSTLKYLVLIYLNHVMNLKRTCMFFHAVNIELAILGTTSAT